jgi:hypothetical protein
MSTGPSDYFSNISYYSIPDDLLEYHSINYNANKSIKAKKSQVNQNYIHYDNGNYDDLDATSNDYPGILSDTY